MAMQVTIPPALAEVAKGRDHLFTDEFSRALGCKPQTARKNHSISGVCYGIRPIRLGNKLLWPVAEIARLLQGGGK